VAIAAGAGLRWGEAVGVCEDVLDLDRRVVDVRRTVIEVAGHTSFKPFPKSAAGRRSIPLPGWVVAVLREHLDTYPLGAGGLVFTNAAGGALRRTLFRSRVWRPALVRAGLLGSIRATDGDRWVARWTDEHGDRHELTVRSETQAVNLVARGQHGGLRFHDLRHSYATWLVDDGVPPNMVQKVMGHERSATTLDLYTRRTDAPDRILQALDDDDPDDGDTGGGGALVPA
jgi:integrase